MSERELRWPSTGTVSVLAALTTWVSLWAWAGFTERASGFLIPTLGGCLMLAGIGMLLRSARWPFPLVLLAQALAVFLWLNHRWAADLSAFGWLPTSASVSQIGAVLADAVAAAQSYAAPVPAEVGEIHAVLILAGMACALMVDLLACGLRRVPAAGLPLLAVYTAPVSILDGGVPWWGFVAGALAFLSLLAADEGRRIAHWGRQVSMSNRFADTVATPASSASIRDSARKIGFTATGLAVVVPIFVPVFSGTLFDGSGPGGDGDGDAVAISNPIVNMRRDLFRGRDVDLLRVSTSGQVPAYLRVSVLDSFDGETWKPSGRDIPVEQRAEGTIALPPGLDPGVTRRESEYEVQVGSQFRSRWLPTLYPATEVDARGDWRYDTSTLDFISAVDGQTTAGLDYRFRALEVDPAIETLSNAGPAPDEVFTQYTELPASMPDQVPSLAREVTAGQPSRFEKARRLQEWFREDGGFEYSLERSAGGNGTEDLLRFLGTGPESRVGYCEQFASAMAVMGRTLGIPSRVAVGFLKPDKVSDVDYVFSAHDLHAWPEMYFEGAGWIRFEPTPADRAEGVPGYTLAQVPGEEPSALPSSAAPSRLPDDFDRPSAAPGPRAGDEGPGPDGTARDVLTAIGVAMVTAVLVWTPRALRLLVRRRRWSSVSSPADAAEVAWSELRDAAVDLGLPWDDAVTLRTRARALAASFGEPPGASAEERSLRTPQTGAHAHPEATRALERIVRHVERARFSRNPAESEGLREDVALCEEALRAGATPRRRLRATWLPASLVRSASRRRTASAPPLAEPGLDRAL